MVLLYLLTFGFVKALDTFGIYSNYSHENFLGMSNGELLKMYRIVRNDFLY